MKYVISLNLLHDRINEFQEFCDNNEIKLLVIFKEHQNLKMSFKEWLISFSSVSDTYRKYGANSNFDITVIASDDAFTMIQLKFDDLFKIIE